MEGKRNSKFLFQSNVKQLMGLISPVKSRPYSSPHSPQVKLIKYHLRQNLRLKSTKKSFTAVMCLKCRRPKPSPITTDSSFLCECSKSVILYKKPRVQKHTNSNSAIPLITYPIVSVNIPGFPLRSRNLSTIQRSQNSFNFAALGSADVLNDSLTDPSPIASKLRRKDETSRYKYLVFKGNNSGVIKRLMDLRNEWSEGYFSLPSSANFMWMPTSANIRFERLKPGCSQFVNHFEFHSELTNKSKLYLNLGYYCTSHELSLASIMPATFLVDFKTNNYFSQIHSFKVFMINIHTKGIPITHYNGKNVWLLKPAGFNRGRGISVFRDSTRLDALVKDIVSNKTSTSANSYIIQKYIERPLLINLRKFDIRVWVLICQNYNCYFFPQGYLRTASELFTLDHLESKFVHLTNNAIQKDSKEYGKFEAGNQLSFKDFQDYLTANYGNIRLSSIISIIKSQITTSLKSVQGKLNSNERVNCFEIFGYDFIVDCNFRPWLIEVNTNPCLELSSPLLEQLIPRMLDDALELTIDNCFPSARTKLKSTNIIELPVGNLWEYLVCIGTHPALAVSGVVCG